MITDKFNGFISTKIKGKIAFLEFWHPASNSLPTDLLTQLVDEFHRLGKNSEVTVIVLKSQGERAFCAGASFDQLLEISNSEEGFAFFSGFAHLINAMRKCPKIIVGRVHGKVVGGGVGLVAACDYVFSTIEGSIKLSELSIGIGPFVIAPAIERKIGKTALTELSLSAHEWKEAYWAKEKGLYAKVFDKTDELDKDLEIFCYKLSTYNPEALTALKKVLWEGTESWDNLLVERAKISGQLVLSDFTKQALTRLK